MSRQPWTELHLQVLRARYADTPTAVIAEQIGRTERSVYQKATALGLRKNAAYLASPAAGRLRPGATIGGATKFAKGHRTWNAGMAGWSAPGAERTQFIAGNRPQTWRPVGTERVSKDGYLQRKMTDAGRGPRDWIGVHILVWEAAHGAVPAGHAVVFRDGDKQRIMLENLELVSRVELMRRNTVHRLPENLKQVIRLKASLTRKIHEHD